MNDALLAGDVPLSTEVTTCPVCGSAESKLVSERGRFGMAVRNVCCATCAAVYVTPRPSQEGMAEYYRSAYRKHYGGVGYLLPDGSTVSPGQEGFAATLRQWHESQAKVSIGLAQTKPGARVLEVGCRHALTLRLMRDTIGIDAHGIEPGESEAEEARSHGVTCFTGSVEDFDAGDVRFDQIQLFHVLEHLHEPLSSLLHLRKFLKPDGVFLIEVPNLYRPYGLLEENFFQNVHLATYSPNTLPVLFQRAGLSIERLVNASSLHIVGKRVESPATLPRPFTAEMLPDAEQNADWVMTRLRSYANLEKLSFVLKQRGYTPNLFEPLIHTLQWPAFLEHLTEVCAQFMETFAARGLMREALMMTLSIANGPFPEDLRNEFRRFAERINAQPENDVGGGAVLDDAVAADTGLPKAG
jgi:SAM-dependent methyltransferase